MKKITFHPFDDFTNEYCADCGASIEPGDICYIENDCFYCEECISNEYNSQDQNLEN